MQLCSSAQIHAQPRRAPLIPVAARLPWKSSAQVSHWVFPTPSSSYLVFISYHKLKVSLPTFVFPFLNSYPFTTPILLSSPLFSSFLVIPSPIHSSAGIHNHAVLSLKNHALLLSKSQNPSQPSFPSNYYYFIYFFLETHVGCQV